MPPETILSVDLDPVGCYHAIHGLPPPAPGPCPVLERCLPRFLDLFARLGARATFFVVGHSAAAARAAGGVAWANLRRARDEGHEVAHHSFAHAYDMVRWPRARILDDLRRGSEVLAALGERPVGFRAPGYTHDPNLLAALIDEGFRYDSSRLPAPAYYLAKLAVISAMALAGRCSASQVRGAGAFFGSSAPRRIVGGRLWEVPISVTPALRLPYVGTFLLAGPWPLREHLRIWARARGRVHLELHGLDLADAAADDLAPELVRRQPELRVPLQRKISRLEAFLAAREPARSIRAWLDTAAEGAKATRTR